MGAAFNHETSHLNHKCQARLFQYCNWKERIFGPTHSKARPAIIVRFTRDGSMRDATEGKNVGMCAAFVKEKKKQAI